MDIELAEKIETWFESHDENGDFVRSERTVPYTVVGPKQDQTNIIYSTKPGLISEVMYEFPAASEFGLVGRCGLPNRSDVEWLRSFVGERTLCFFGDLDPGDLLVFAWLRAMLAPLQLMHIGVNECMLEKLGVSLADEITIPLSQSEQAALELLPGAFPDLREVVGRKCIQLLDAGSKMEVEAIVCNREKTEQLLRLLGSSGNE